MYASLMPVVDPEEGSLPPPPIFLDQTEARRAQKNLCRGGGRLPPPLSKGLDDLPPPLIQHCLHLYYMHCKSITPCFPGFQSNVAFSSVITIQEDK